MRIIRNLFIGGFIVLSYRLGYLNAINNATSCGKPEEEDEG